MFTENSENKDIGRPLPSLPQGLTALAGRRVPWPAPLALLVVLAAGRLLGDPPSSLLAVGLPLAGGGLLALCPRARSATGRLLQGISLVLLAAALFFPQVVLLLAPLCYSAGLALGLAHDTARRTGNSPSPASREAPASTPQPRSSLKPADRKTHRGPFARPAPAMVPAEKAPRSAVQGS